MRGKRVSNGQSWRDIEGSNVSTLGSLGRFLAAAICLGVLVGLIAVPGLWVLGRTTSDVARGVQELPRELTAEQLAQRTRVVGTDGSLLATWYDQNRVDVQLNKVAPVMQEAILAIEDYRFYQHGALDLKGTLRAFLTNQANDGVVQGGSSITQQMVKMTLQEQAKTDADRRAASADSYTRKIRELRYAIAFEQAYPKQWILERYLNIAYFGDGAYGVEAASRHYFSKPAKRLNLRQAALLAGIVKNPSAYDPTNDADAARIRRDVVLNRMAELAIISAEEAEAAKSKDLGLKLTQARNGCVSTKAPWFCDYVREWLLQDPRLGKTVEERENLLDSGGLTIKTTLDPRFQIAADNAVKANVFAADQAVGALALVVPGTGEVRALAQSRPMGREEKKGETFLNWTVPEEFGDSGGAQAGSTFKPFILAAAVNQGISLSTRISSPQSLTVDGSEFSDCAGKPQGFSDWSVSNSTGSGTFDLYSGTQQSVNTFFAQLEARTGLCDPITLVEDLGIPVPDRDRVGPFTLGVTYTNPLSLASAYAAFAGRGVYCEPRPVSEILDARGRSIVRYQDDCDEVIDPDVADAVNDVLRGVVEPGGFGDALAPGQPAAGKTGTIQQARAVWFSGYTPNLAGAAMIAGTKPDGGELPLAGLTVGGQYISSPSGSREAGPIWGDAFKALAEFLPDVDFVSPDPQTVAGRRVIVPDVIGMSTTTASGVLARAGFSAQIGDFIDSDLPRGTVAALSVSPGEYLGTGSTVTMLISDGTPKRNKPDPKPSRRPEPRPTASPTEPEPTAEPTETPTEEPAP